MQKVNRLHSEIQVVWVDRESPGFSSATSSAITDRVR